MVVWCSTGVVLEWCLCGGVFVVVFVVVFLWWCFCGGVFVVAFLWWCSCGGVFVVVFLWWCFCGGVFVVVFLWRCCGGGVAVVFLLVVFLWWCGGVFVCFFCQGSTFVALPRSYAKSVDNTGVKRCLVYKISLHCSYPHSHQTFPSFNCLHCFRDIRRLVFFVRHNIW